MNINWTFIRHNEQMRWKFKNESLKYVFLIEYGVNLEFTESTIILSELYKLSSNDNIWLDYNFQLTKQVTLAKIELERERERETLYSAQARVLV